MGKPGQGNTWSPPPEYIGRLERTRGIEPSKYPQEKKATAIRLVAASERGSSLNRRRVKPVSVAFSGSWDQDGFRHRGVGKLQTVFLVE